MSKAKGYLAVTAVTVLNVLTARLVIGDLAVMLWGTFDRVFFVSFALWWVFFGALYFIAAMGADRARSGKKTVVCATVFGLCVTVLKMIPDVLIFQSLRNLLPMVYWYGIEDILIGTAVMQFLFWVTGRQSNRKRSFVLTSLLTTLGAAALQSAAAAYYWNRFQTLSSKEPMAEMLANLYVMEEAKNLQLINGLIFITFYILMYWQIRRKTDAS